MKNVADFKAKVLEKVSKDEAEKAIKLEWLIFPHVDFKRKKD